MYYNLLFIDVFKNNQTFSRCKLFFDSHGIAEFSHNQEVDGTFTYLHLSYIVKSTPNCLCN